MDAATKQLVRQRAGNRCEYCLLPEKFFGLRFHIEHIVPVKDGGTDETANLALACASCNLAKSTKTSGIDPTTKLSAQLFNPRSERWEDHFRWRDQRTIEGVTTVGRVTVGVLQMNSEIRIEARVLWFAARALH